MHTRVKICGITNINDLRLAVSAGADALGFNMFPESPRFLTIEMASQLVEQVPPFVTTVGLFVNAQGENVRDISRINFDLLQFHGDETDEYCRGFDKPYLRVIRVKPDLDIAAEVEKYPGSAGILLDAYVADKFGGSGNVINWRDLPVLKGPMVLAGGLNAKNVIQAIALAKPFAVDVCSGVEISKGVKDPKKIHEFIAAVSVADKSG